MIAAGFARSTSLDPAFAVVAALPTEELAQPAVAEATMATLIGGAIVIALCLASATLWIGVLRRRARGERSELVPVRARSQCIWSPSRLLVATGVFVLSFFVSLLLGAGAMTVTQAGAMQPQASDAQQSTASSPKALADAAERDPDDGVAADGVAADGVAADGVAADGVAADGVATRSADGVSATSPAASSQTMTVRIAINSLAGLVAVAMTVLYLRTSQPGDAASVRGQLGLNWPSGDGRLGLTASLMLLPPVLLLSALVSFLIPYHHPVLESLTDDPSLGTFLLMLLSTALITPLVEEFFFRVLLQGGLQAIADQPAGDDAACEGRPTPWRPQSWWPVVVVSTLFACMHLGQGAAPIPLFVLSLGLGYLYRQTGSISTPFIIHAVLNFLTLAVKFSQLSENVPA